MITLKNIEKVYRTDTIETLALNNINLEVAQGEFLSIMGPSGCGKSTTIQLLERFYEPTDGEIVSLLIRSFPSRFVHRNPDAPRWSRPSWPLFRAAL